MNHREISRSRISHAIQNWMTIPIYQSRLRDGSCLRTTEEFATHWRKVPLVTKQEIRDGFPERFLRSGQSLDDLLRSNTIELEHTSGTSGESLSVMLERGWWGEQEERALRGNGAVARLLDDHPEPPRVILTTPACNGSACPTAWTGPDHRTIGKSLFVNRARIPFVLNETELWRMAQEISDWRPLLLDLDPVHGTWFALFCERHGLTFPSIRVVITSYEYLSVVHRQIMERVYGVPLLNLYGATETGHLLMEDEMGRMRSCEENAFLEVIDPDSRGVGPLIVTTLTNYYMPLLRYRIGDLAQHSGQDHGVYWLHGRERDAIRAADERMITTRQVDECFAELRGFAHYQFRQSAADQYHLTFVPEHAGPAPATIDTVRGRLAALVETVNPIPVEMVPAIVPEASGKFRLTRGL